MVGSHVNDDTGAEKWNYFTDTAAEAETTTQLFTKAQSDTYDVEM